MLKPQDLQIQIQKLQQDLNALSQEVYLNNFTGHQDFNKSCFFNSRLKVPHYDSLPTTCEVGEIAESAGKLRVCSSADTWSIVGSQA